jgi:hypothetical protein
MGFELRAFSLAKQILYCLRHASSPFCPSYFGDRSLSKVFAQVGFKP